MSDDKYIKALLEECINDLSNLNDLIDREEQRGRLKLTRAELLNHHRRKSHLIDERLDLLYKIRTLTRKLKCN